MAPKIIITLSTVFLLLNFQYSKAESFIRAGYWDSSSGLPISEIQSQLFTHLICGYTALDSSSYELSINSYNEQCFSNFTNTVKEKNPSVSTLLSIDQGMGNTIFSQMVSNSSYRKSFIDSSMKLARLHGFQGLDLRWLSAIPFKGSADMTNLGVFFKEWREAATSQTATNSSSQEAEAELILTAAVQCVPPRGIKDFAYPVDSIRRYLNWIHCVAYDYYNPLWWWNSTAAPAPLFNPSSDINTDFGIRTWIAKGMPPSKLVLTLPFIGFAWKLANPKENSIGAPAIGQDLPQNGFIVYKNIKSYIKTYNAQVTYNATYVVNYVSFGSTWIGFDDVEAIKAKVSYAKEKKLLGYVAIDVTFDDNWLLSLTGMIEATGLKPLPSPLSPMPPPPPPPFFSTVPIVGLKNSSKPLGKEVGGKAKNKLRLLVIILVSVSTTIFVVAALLYYFLKRSKVSKVPENSEAAADFNNNVPILQVFSLADVEAATKGFSIKNKLGQGGYGPVYKGVLPNGQEVAVKKLSTASRQGFDEFKNEVVLTAKLQHVNLVRVIGFCIEQDEQMLIYEYMPNKSLDLYLFDPCRRYFLDWEKRVNIIEGVTQGLLYLQEYSRFTIIHRDLKASNILLDDEMKPKISDFGMAKIFSKDGLEASTSRIVGTLGYIPPEYANQGLYSTKSDVYSFGVLLLQIISGKRISHLYGFNEDLNLLEYAYALWKVGKGKEFMEPLLEDSLSSCKLIKCMQIALLCVQENANDRPSMLEVSSMLKNENTVMVTPKKPGFAIRNENQLGGAVKSRQADTSSSINEATISELLPR